LERNAVVVNANYATTDFKYGGALEYRNDKQALEERDSYLVRNNLSYKVNPDWRAQLRIDFAISNSSIDESLNSDYSEALLGFAYRPVANDRFNALLTYNYLYDLAPAEQFTASYQQNDYQQRSHVAAIDMNYDLTARWTIGGKIAHRTG
jgi:lipopolysaccharide assembly outer membrane protein LptD (OstA)